MSEKRFQMGRRIDVVSDIYDSQKDKLLILSDVVDCLNEQQATIEQKDKEIKGLEEKIQRIYVNVCSAMSEVIDDE